jgi:DNA repair exonuclease SbcCD ATPase subunit
MNKIILKKLTLLNFKGVKNLEINFDEKETNIYGANGSGKTSLVDSFSWLLYGKDSQNRTDFDVKTLDSQNKPIHNLNHEVEGVFIVGGSEIVFKRVYLEKWTKKKGNETEELTGHTTNYFINEVPVSLSEYKTKVDSFLNENTQKILSNPLYFNQLMKWNDRRVVLSRLAGEISDDSIVEMLDQNTKECIQKLFATDKSLEDYKREYQAKRKKVKEELETIPSRIDEATRNIPGELNFNAIEQEIKVKEDSINKIDIAISDKSKELDSQFENIKKVKQLKFNKEQELQSEIELSSKESKELISKIEFEISDIKHKNHLINDKIKTNNYQIESLKSGEQQKQESINNLIFINSELRKDWESLNSSELKLNEDDCVCPTCKREYEVDKVSEIKSNSVNNFNESKASKLKAITDKGVENKKNIQLFEMALKSIQIEIINHESEIESLKNQSEILIKDITSLNEKLESIKITEVIESDKAKSIKKEIECIVIPEVKEIDTTELKERKSILQSELKELQEQLFLRKQIETSKLRVSELEEQQKKLAQQIAGYEKFELAIEKFNKAKIDFIENSINKKFKNIKFKMFEEQVNGGVAETCICTMNGVNYESLNTASKINAGIECINVIADFYQTQVPLFLDCRESVTTITETDFQVINLFVDPTSKTLKF